MPKPFAVNILESDIYEAKRLEIIKRMCEDDLIFFAAYFFRELRGEQFIENSHHYTIARALKEVERGGNLLLNLPPRYGKTELGVICWIAQSIAHNPKAKFIHMSYSSELALDNSAKCRELIKSEKFQYFWPVKIKSDSDSKAKWYTEQGGGLYATMAGGAITGFGAGVTAEDDEGLFGGAIIIDDPLKPDDARSDLEREKVNERLNTTIKSRRNSRNTPIVIIMQRLHEEDMSGFVLRGGMGEPFKHVNLKALQDDGTALWPLKHTVEELHRMRENDRWPYVFSTQYQQEPAPTDGDVYKRDWFVRYTSLPQPPTRTMIVHSWDTAYKKGTHNDPSVCTIWHVTPSLYYLAEVVTGRWDYPELRAKALELIKRDSPDAILVEDKASGQSLIQEIQSNTSLPAIAIQPEADKETRARTTAAAVEAQRVALPNDAPWLSAYEREMLLFPNGKHDDQVDSTSQFLKWINGRAGDSVARYEQLLESF